MSRRLAEGGRKGGNEKGEEEEEKGEGSKKK